MKILAMSMMIMISGMALADKPSLGETDPKSCECETCLVRNGICTRTHANGERSNVDKNQSSKKKGKSKSSGASQG